ncbi:MAG: large-conductance mechanosensitive channel protein MscL [Bacteroidetes bacterium]|nr:large-conductance mechanosensitive channel protein MscL [Bacteroidota bacterium]MBP8754034.1 large-conductance mechanosensitive channel protein MscL [Chitinophagales bacterium]MBK8680639.1 large-conductance mechanosensitive channel protein MscL [Bacteroidota bacterium]MBP9189096.1 large-conductance mechanosensitive channel protein MscL [Chitinophagales bacterium]MBP9548762.1 large-conductance mechanosensitive channel protein MscL [Chitinophagales bacterium]
MGMLKEFKEFAMKGNLVDIAVGFVMGAAFAKVTTTFINGIVMPPIGMIQGKDMSDWKYVIKDATMDAEGKVANAEVAIQYGTFISTAIEFIIIAFVMFMVIKGINSMKKKVEAVPAAPPAPTSSEVLLMEIRDLLKK